jgi:hypothetical protein
MECLKKKKRRVIYTPEQVEQNRINHGETVKCKKCSVHKPYNMYHKSIYHTLGVLYTCKECKNKSNKERLSDPNKKSKALERSRKWREQNKDKHSQSHQNWRSKNPDYPKEYYKKNKQRMYAKNQEWVKNNPKKSHERAVRFRNTDKCKDYIKKYTSDNKEKLRKIQAEWYLLNKEKKKIQGRFNRIKNADKYKETSRRYNRLEYVKKANRARRSFRRASEQSKISKYFAKEIRLFYENCPDDYHVDHIIPLKHDKVCGLHVPWNFQYLTAFENMSKGNKIV